MPGTGAQKSERHDLMMTRRWFFMYTLALLGHHTQLLIPHLELGFTPCEHHCLKKQQRLGRG